MKVAAMTEELDQDRFSWDAMVDRKLTRALQASGLSIGEMDEA